ncbi:patatin-like phospholipase family protein [Flavobacterium branchiophilum]|uniref:Patatin n=1 Tax=Flavobacterium branchiophilum TaxID=55197 RepID=A0A2H3K9U3_9FLAO|nr:patatin-like phospholipase family protein [Flavobacterium branchiophilum]PDS23080.1 patatin [Flavobacterium branchiophilum]
MQLQKHQMKDNTIFWQSLKMIVIMSFLWSYQYSYAQNQRPKVGLVLSGGGAKGFAHIGVLKVLEQAGVKIDYIGGTSMGSVVGGLYASGYNAQQIDSIFKSTDFDELIKDFIPRSSKTFYEKKNDELYAVTLPFRKFRIGLPLALSKGLYNYNLLTKLTHHVRNINDFSKLPIPFVCVGTDVETGKEVLFKGGYLPQAILASSAFPTLFMPVEIDHKLIVDGGVSNNYPVEEVRRMGADIIIGVDVQDDLKGRRALTDATKIFTQISNLQMIEKMQAKKNLTDIYIKPDIEKYGVVSFDEGRAIIKKGEEAAFAVYEKFKALAAVQNNDTKQEAKPINESICIASIQINHLKNYTYDYVIGKLGFRGGSQITFTDLNLGINKLNATQNFSDINYKIHQTSDGQNELIMELKENRVKTFLKFGMHYDGLYKSGLLLNLTQKKLLFKNDVASIDVILGDNFRYNFDYYIDNGFYWSFGVKSKYNVFNRNVYSDFKENNFLQFEGLRSLNIDFSSLSNQIYVQTVFAQQFLLGIGAEFDHLKISSNNLDNNAQIIEKNEFASGYLALKFDNFDNKYFPKKGFYFSSDFQTYLYSSTLKTNFKPFSILKVDFGIARSFHKKTTLTVQADAGLSIGERQTAAFDFVFGGYGFNPTKNIKPFYGYDFLSVSGNSYIKATVTMDYEIFKKNHLNFSANFANIENNLFEKVNWISRSKYSGYALGYGIETVIGPIEIKQTYSPETGKGYTWFAVGFWF